MRHSAAARIAQLFVKELRSLWNDKVLLVFIIWAFSGGIYVAATATSQELHNAPIAIVDEDHSPLSKQIRDAFYPPNFKAPESITFDEVDPALDAGRYTFVLMIPAGFERDVLAGKQPTLQINIDATRMTQAFLGDSYIQNIISGELTQFVSGQQSDSALPIQLIPRYKFNPSLTSTWFGSIMEIISNVTMLSVILAGAAVVREREHGTLEHLLVMPLTPLEIVASKVLANGAVILLAVTLSLLIVVKSVLGVPIHGSPALFILGAALNLFATTSLGIFLGTIARSMPQLGLLFILTILPLNMLSGGVTPRESMPDLVQNLMLATPNTHFVSLAQAILYRGAGVETVWPQFLMLLLIGAVFFLAATALFRRSVANA
ncbi:MAG: ABC transporter permease [Gammaproteobacteria bacterium]|nr:ABC transporter permease [Gammaproteobacteria bacterium]